ncbi:unnamed protein product [Closterium sp. Yama58-4]|nr:unnamed protein product [Closterium sp. Yama58-4]
MREEERKRAREEEANKRREVVRKATEALAKARRCKKELKVALREAARAVAGLKEGVEAKVKEVLLRAALIRCLEEETPPFQAVDGGSAGRKRPRMADGSAVAHRMREPMQRGQEGSHGRDNPNLSLSFFLNHSPGLYASLSSLTLHRLSPITAHSLSYLRHLPSLTALSILETSINPLGVFQFSPFSRLHRLVLDCPDASELLDLDPESIYACHAEPFAKLRELHISRVTNDMLQEIGRLTSLEAFSCTCCKEVSEWGLRNLDELTRLTRLQVAPANLHDHHLQLQCWSDSLPDISRVCQRPTPSSKRMCDCGEGLYNPKYPCLDGSVWRLVGALQGLQQLGVHGVARSSQDLQALTALTGLTSLHITGTYLNDDAFFKGFSQLRDLGLAGCNVDAASYVWGWSRTMPLLKSLDLSATGISYKGAAQLYLLTSLERLKVQQCCNLHAAFLRHVSLIPQLKELDVGFNNVQPGWLRPIRDEKQVARLCVRGCGWSVKQVHGVVRSWLEVER